MADRLYYVNPNTPKAPTTGKGMLAPGNINVYDRPIVPNPTRDDPSQSSTVRSSSFDFGHGEVLLPTVSDGADGRAPHLMSNPESVAYYRKTGQNLGTFDNPDNATAFANSLHEQQAGLGAWNGRTTFAPHVTSEALGLPPLAGNVMERALGWVK